MLKFERLQGKILRNLTAERAEMSIDFEKALDGWIENNVSREAAGKNKSEYVNALIKLHHEQIRLLTRIGSENKDEDIYEFTARSEKLFLRAKALTNFAEGKEVLLPGKAAKIFSSETYELSKTADGYVLMLPPMVSQYKINRRMQEGKAIYFLVLDLVRRFEKEHGRVTCFDRAEISFIHFIDINLPEVSVPDPDNIDIKKVIDALQGSVISEDNLLHLELEHRAYLSSQPHTEVYVKRLENIEQKNGMLGEPVL